MSASREHGRCEHAASDCADVRRELRALIDAFKVENEARRAAERERDAWEERYEWLLGEIGGVAPG